MGIRGWVKMDEKVMEMLAKILEGQNDLQKELKQEIRAVSTKVDRLETRVEEVSTKVDRLETRVEEVSTKVDRLETRVEEVSTKVDMLEMRVEEVSTKVDKLEMRVEYEVIDKIKIVFDAREVQNDSITNISDTLNRVEAKLEVLQLETAHIRRVK